MIRTADGYVGGYKQVLIGLLSVMVFQKKVPAATGATNRNWIKPMIMLTGDHHNVGDSIARQLELTEAKAFAPDDR